LVDEAANASVSPAPGPSRLREDSHTPFRPFETIAVAFKGSGDGVRSIDFSYPMLWAAVAKTGC